MESDKGRDGESNRPWEEPGAVRRDCKSHRGPVLLLLGHVGWICSFLVLLLACPLGNYIPVQGFLQIFPMLYVVSPMVFFLLCGLSLSLVARVLSKRDLVGMVAGRIDPTGEDPTRRAGEIAAVGLVLFSVNTALWLLLLFLA